MELEEMKFEKRAKKIAQPRRRSQITPLRIIIVILLSVIVSILLTDAMWTNIKRNKEISSGEVALVELVPHQLWGGSQYLIIDDYQERVEVFFVDGIEYIYQYEGTHTYKERFDHDKTIRISANDTKFAYANKNTHEIEFLKDDMRKSDIKTVIVFIVSILAMLITIIKTRSAG